MIRKHIDEQGVADILVCLKQSLDSEGDEAVICDIGAAVEEFTPRPLTERVESETYILQVLGGIETFLFSNRRVRPHKVLCKNE